MNPHCPNCLSEMSKAASARNLYNCNACGEIIHFFGSCVDLSDADAHFSWPIRRKAAHGTVGF